jgi:hypothetical protein
VGVVYPSTKLCSRAGETTHDAASTRQKAPGALRRANAAPPTPPTRRQRQHARCRTIFAAKIPAGSRRSGAVRDAATRGQHRACGTMLQILAAKNCRGGALQKSVSRPRADSIAHAGRCSRFSRRKYPREAGARPQSVMRPSADSIAHGDDAPEIFAAKFPEGSRRSAAVHDRPRAYTAALLAMHADFRRAKA